MSGPCPIISSDTSGAQSMVAAVDCFVKTAVQENYASLMGAGSNFNAALTILLTLYVAILGYQLIFGQASINLRDIAPKMLLVGGMLALATNWAAYQTLIFDVLTDGPQEVVGMISPQAGNTDDLMARVDVMTNHMVDAADAWANSTVNPATKPEAPPINASALAAAPLPKASLGPNVLLLSAMLVMLTSAGILVVAKALLGLLLALGPLFLALALFRFTRGLAMGWLRVATLLALVPVLSLVMTYGALTVLEPLVVELNIAANADDFSLRMAATLLVAAVVITAIGLQLFKMATAITAHWTAASAHTTYVPHPSSSSETPTPSPAPSASPQSNARIDHLVGAMERTVTNPSESAVPVQRMIFQAATAPDATASAAPTGNTTRQRYAGTGFARSSGAGALLRPVRG
jgi:type IV secretion system protein VirB6